MATSQLDVTQSLPLRHNRDFVRLWVGEAVSVLGSRISWVAFPLLVLSLTHSPAKAGIVGFANSLPALLLGIPAGTLVDRWRRRRTMIVCDALRALLFGSLAVTLFLGKASFVQVVLIAFLSRCADVFFNPAEVASLQRVVPSVQLPEAVARNESREYGAFLIGPSVGGALYGIGRALPFLADAVSYCISLVSILLVRTDLGPDKQGDGPPSTFIRDLREGLGFTWRTPFLRSTMLILGGSNLISNGTGLALILAVRQHGASAAAVGAMLTISGIGGLLGSLAAPMLQKRLSPFVAVASASIAWMVIIALFPLSLNPFVVSVLLGTMLFAAPTLNATLIGHQIAIVPNHLQARVDGAASVVITGAVAIGALAAGVMLARLGATATIETFAALMALLALVLVSSRSVRRGLSTDPANGAPTLHGAISE
jgi:predicted MFS family arabinose efflux permease